MQSNVMEKRKLALISFTVAVSYHLCYLPFLVFELYIAFQLIRQFWITTNISIKFIESLGLSCTQIHVLIRFCMAFRARITERTL